MDAMTPQDIVEHGNRTDIGLEMLVASQARCPQNFADLMTWFMDSEPDPHRLNFYLSSALATAIIRLASNERIASAS